MFKTFRLMIVSFMFGSTIVIGLVYKGLTERVMIFIIPLLLIAISKDITMKNILKVMTSIMIAIILTSGIMFVYYSGAFSEDESFDGEDKENTAIILLIDGEPTTYEVDKILKNIYKEKEIKKKIFAPLYAYEYKRAYELLGTSRYSQIANVIKEELIFRLKMDYDVLLYYYNDFPYIYDDMNRLSREYDKIIICPISMGNTQEYDDLENLINMRLINNNSTITKLPFLWQSKKLMRSMYLDIVSRVPTNKAHSSGVIMLMTDDVGLYEQTIFASELTQRLINYGIDKKAIISIVLDGSDRDLKRGLTLMLDKDIFDVVVINVGSIENTILDRESAESLISDFRKSENMNINYISGWGLSNDLMDEIEYEIRINNLK